MLWLFLLMIVLTNVLGGDLRRWDSIWHLQPSYLPGSLLEKSSGEVARLLVTIYENRFL